VADFEKIYDSDYVVGSEYRILFNRMKYLGKVIYIGLREDCEKHLQSCLSESRGNTSKDYVMDKNSNKTSKKSIINEQLKSEVNNTKLLAEEIQFLKIQIDSKDEEFNILKRKHEEEVNHLKRKLDEEITNNAKMSKNTS
jgi:hypothetical protein